MEVVLYTSSFVPGEWVAAHGLVPRRVIPHAAGQTAMGLCPFAAGFMHTALRYAAAGIIVTTECDQMRRACERFLEHHPVPHFLMHVPATWETPASHRLYRDELARLSRFLASIGGTAPCKTTLIEIMNDYEQRRRAFHSIVALLPARDYVRARVAFHEEGAILPRPATPVRPTGKPLALVGGPLLFEHLALFEQIEAAGGRVVLEATAEGERGMPAPFDRRKLAEDPLGCLADAYFGAILDAFRRPNDALYSWLGRRLPESGAAGIAFVHYVWCDLWHAEAERLRQWTALPVLALDLAEDGLTGPVRTRLEAFVEMLP